MSSGLQCSVFIECFFSVPKWKMCIAVYKQIILLQCFKGIKNILSSLRVNFPVLWIWIGGWISPNQQTSSRNQRFKQTKHFKTSQTNKIVTDIIPCTVSTFPFQSYITVGGRWHLTKGQLPCFQLYFLVLVLKEKMVLLKTKLLLRKFEATSFLFPCKGPIPFSYISHIISQYTRKAPLYMSVYICVIWRYDRNHKISKYEKNRKDFCLAVALFIFWSFLLKNWGPTNPIKWFKVQIIFRNSKMQVHLIAYLYFL